MFIRFIQYLGFVFLHSAGIASGCMGWLIVRSPNIDDLNPDLVINADNLAINPNLSQFFKLNKPVEYDKKINISCIERRFA